MSLLFSLIVLVFAVNSVARSQVTDSIPSPPAVGLSPLVPVTALNFQSFVGSWFMMYSSKEPLDTLLNYALCATVDINFSEDASHLGTSNILSLDVELSFSVNSPSGQAQQLDGKAINTQTLTNPGVFSLSMNRQISVMYILAVGDNPTNSTTFVSDSAVSEGRQLQDKDDESYPWAIVSNPTGSQLFILARDLKDYGQHYDALVMERVRQLGFTTEDNKPIPIAQPAQCVYNEADD